MAVQEKSFTLSYLVQFVQNNKKYWHKITSNGHKMKSGLLIVVIITERCAVNRKKELIKYINFKFWMERHKIQWRRQVKIK